jgi:hypothetical protein
MLRSLSLCFSLASPPPPLVGDFRRFTSAVFEACRVN